MAGVNGQCNISCLYYALTLQNSAQDLHRGMILHRERRVRNLLFQHLIELFAQCSDERSRADRSAEVDPSSNLTHFMSPCPCTRDT